MCVCVNNTEHIISNLSERKTKNDIKTEWIPLLPFDATIEIKHEQISSERVRSQLPNIYIYTIYKCYVWMWMSTDTQLHSRTTSHSGKYV